VLCDHSASSAVNVLLLKGVEDKPHAEATEMYRQQVNKGYT